MHTIKGLIFGEDFRFHRGELCMEDGCFSQIKTEEAPVVLPKEEDRRMKETYIIPGLTDIHFHGCGGYDFCSGDYEGLKAIASCLAQNGVTSFAIASMTQPEEILTKAYANGARLRREQPKQGARILGINMEGPFFSKQKRGAQPEAYLQQPDWKMVERLDLMAEGLLKIVCVAPELPGAMDFIKLGAKHYTVSLGHTAADYDTAKAAITAGACQVTHLFNGMMPLLHREPGVIGAAAEAPGVRAELICDGVHVHESAVRAAFGLFGSQRIVLISDSLSVCGAPEGAICQSGGVDITLKNGAAVLPDGITLAGSATSLFECMRRAISFGIPPEDAVRAASFNPAQSIGETAVAGSISSGKPADFLLCDREFHLMESYVRGRRVR